MPGRIQPPLGVFPGEMRLRSLIIAIVLPALLVLMIEHSPGVLLHLNREAGQHTPYVSR